MISEQDTHLILRRGEITAEGLTRYGSNYTFLVKVAYNGGECLAIYNPATEKLPYGTFREARSTRGSTPLTS